MCSDNKCTNHAERLKGSHKRYKLRASAMVYKCLVSLWLSQLGKLTSQQLSKAPTSKGKRVWTIHNRLHEQPLCSWSASEAQYMVCVTGQHMICVNRTAHNMFQQCPCSACPVQPMIISRALHIICINSSAHAMHAQHSSRHVSTAQHVVCVNSSVQAMRAQHNQPAAQRCQPCGADWAASYSGSD